MKITRYLYFKIIFVFFSVDKEQKFYFFSFMYMVIMLFFFELDNCKNYSLFKVCVCIFMFFCTVIRGISRYIIGFVGLN